MNGEMNGTASFFILLPVVVPLVNLIFLFLPLYLCEEEKIIFLLIVFLIFGCFRFFCYLTLCFFLCVIQLCLVGGLVKNLK